jgi:hypothetical protein
MEASNFSRPFLPPRQSAPAQKTWHDPLSRPCLSAPGEHHARRNAITARNLRYLRPGANVTSTIRALSSCDQRRRRSNPPKTSTRIA